MQFQELENLGLMRGINDFGRGVTQFADLGQNITEGIKKTLPIELELVQKLNPWAKQHLKVQFDDFEKEFLDPMNDNIWPVTAKIGQDIANFKNPYEKAVDPQAPELINMCLNGTSWCLLI